MMARMPDVSRRAVLRLGMGAAAGAAGAYVLGATMSHPAVTAPPVSMTGVGVPLAPPVAPPLEPASAPAPTYVTGSFVSAARGGVSTNWAIARPPGQTGPLRPVIALHGKGQDAAGVMAGGVEQGLAQAVAAGIPPFAVVAVDGGGSYWHKRASGEDSGAMVLDELIPMLSGQGLDTSRVGFLGWSMGGYGALLTRCATRGGPDGGDLRGQPRPVDLVGCDGARRVRRCGRLRSQQRVGASCAGSIPIRIDCGNSDPFYSATKQYIAQLPTRRRAVSPPAATTAASGVRSCPPRSAGWRRYSWPSG